MLRLFATIPRGFIAHAVTDTECMPLIRPGEVAVVTDQDFLYPEDGGWYLMAFSKGSGWRDLPRHGRHINIVNERPRPASQGPGTWWYAKPPANRPGTFTCSDGPFDDLSHLAERIVGRVVGIYAPHRTASDPSSDDLLLMQGKSPGPHPPLPHRRARA